MNNSEKTDILKLVIKKKKIQLYATYKRQMLIYKGQRKLES